jgi:hypothetical protein
LGLTNLGLFFELFFLTLRGGLPRATRAGARVNGGGEGGSGGRGGGVGVSEDSIAPSQGASLESAQHNSHGAGAEGGERPTIEANESC